LPFPQTTFHVHGVSSVGLARSDQYSLATGNSCDG
jgi:hypothetical protein